jgi:ectoine hydroxylase-related dioxygenase (phytanoyl-CoA dioxygenase family)
MKNNDLKIKGFTILKDIVNESEINRLKKCSIEAFLKHKEIQTNNNSDIITDGVALHVILNDDYFIEFLGKLLKTDSFKSTLTNYFNGKFIMNSFTALNNLPNSPNFSAIVHRDIKFYSGDVPLMINVLVMLDDFTEENGPTLILPYSHLFEEKPSDEYFHENSIQVLGKKGDILFFNSNIWHCSSRNNTNEDRMALPITFSKSVIKQLLDYPRALGYDKINDFSEDLRQILGYDSRVAANLNEWYQPFENRFYKKNQD